MHPQRTQEEKQKSQCTENPQNREDNVNKNVHKYLQRKTNALSVCPLKHLLESFFFFSKALPDTTLSAGGVQHATTSRTGKGT